jgi:hypothetical protein
MKLNCNRALQRSGKICETGNIQPMKLSGLTIGPWTNQKRGIEEFSLGSSVNP